MKFLHIIYLIAMIGLLNVKEGESMDEMIVGKIQPNIKQQTFFITKNGQIKTQSCPINLISETVFKLSKKYDIYTIKLSGPIAFVQKLAEEIADKEFLKYNYNKLDIQLL